MQHTAAPVHIQHASLKVLHKNGIGGIFEQVAETALALAQFLLNLDTLQGTATLVRQGLQDLHVTRGIAVRPAALDE